MKSLDIAVVGYGLIGKKHCNIIKKQKNIKLSGLVTINKNKIQIKRLGCDIFNSIPELLNKKKPDGAIIASPTNLHLKHSLEFIKHDIPVLIEKPISHSSKGVKQLLKLAKKKSVPILVGHHRRYNQIIKSAKNILNEGQIGKIRSVNSLCWFYKPDQYFKISPWRKNSGAGPILTNLIHDIDLLRFFCGEINSVQSLISRSKRGFKNEDTASVILNFKSGILGTMSVSDSIVSPWSWEMNSKENSDFPFINQNCYFIGGTKGSLSIPDLKIWSHEKKPNWLNSMKVKRFSYKKNNPFVEQINHFIRVIKKIDRPLVSGIEGYKSLKVVEAIKNSAKYNKIIKL